MCFAVWFRSTTMGSPEGLWLNGMASPTSPNMGVTYHVVVHILMYCNNVFPFHSFYYSCRTGLWSTIYDILPLVKTTHTREKHDMDRTSTLIGSAVHVLVCLSLVWMAFTSGRMSYSDQLNTNLAKKKWSSSMSQACGPSPFYQWPAHDSACPISFLTLRLFATLLNGHCTIF